VRTKEYKPWSPSKLGRQLEYLQGSWIAGGLPITVDGVRVFVDEDLASDILEPHPDGEAFVFRGWRLTSQEIGGSGKTVTWTWVPGRTAVELEELTEEHRKLGQTWEHSSTIVPRLPPNMWRDLIVLETHRTPEMEQVVRVVRQGLPNIRHSEVQQLVMKPENVSWRLFKDAELGCVVTYAVHERIVEVIFLVSLKRKRGFGSEVLDKIRQMTVQKNRRFIALQASATAVNFFRGCGYSVFEDNAHCTKSEVMNSIYGFTNATLMILDVQESTTTASTKRKPGSTNVAKRAKVDISSI